MYRCKGRDEDMKNIRAVFWKQIKDTFKNKEVLIQFVMFPLLVILMENAVTLKDLPEHYFVKLFAAMYIGMAPLISMAAVLSEEKEKNTLKALLMSDVKPMEYLLGVGGYIWFICMMGSLVFGITGEYKGKMLFFFLMIMAAGILASLFIGAAIGTWSRNQMMATSLTMPIMIIFSFLPMLSMFNDSIKKVARFAYSEQISILISHLGQVEAKMGLESFVVIVLNAAVAVFCFVFAYRKCGLA